MANSNWNKFYVKCPYFLRDDGKKAIVCEGIIAESTVTFGFRQERDYRIQVETFCKEHYKKCEIYRMLEDVHKED